MTGDDAVRFCGICQKNVYQLSNMSSEQIEALLEEKGGRKCVRFFQRADGTVISDDCSVGKKRKRRKQAVMSAGLGVLSTLGVGMLGGGARPSSKDKGCDAHVQTVTPTDPEPQVIEPVVVEPVVVDPVPEPIEPHEMMMGEMIAIDVDEYEELEAHLDEPTEP